MKELDKNIEFFKEECLCWGDGKICFTLNDKSTIEFRLKHGGEVLEYIFDGNSKIKHCLMTAAFTEIIRNYYSAE